jgi:hypothetical protein
MSQPLPSSRRSHFAARLVSQEIFSPRDLRFLNKDWNNRSTAAICEALTGWLKKPAQSTDAGVQNHEDHLGPSGQCGIISRPVLGYHRHANI